MQGNIIRISVFQAEETLDQLNRARAMLSSGLDELLYNVVADWIEHWEQILKDNGYPIYDDEWDDAQPCGYAFAFERQDTGALPVIRL